MFPEDFHLLRPVSLLLLLPFAWLFWRLLRSRLSRRSWAAVCDPELLPGLLLSAGTGGRRGHRLVLLGLAGLLAIFALAGPAWERLPQPLFRDQPALVIVLEMAESMSVADLAPNRLARARFKITDLLDQSAGRQIALIAYAGHPFVVSPLTDDVENIRSQLESLEPAIMPVPGSRADRALRLAAERLREAGYHRGDVLLISDGLEPVGAALREAVYLYQEGYRVSALGVGTSAGAPVPGTDGRYLKDASGSILIAALERQGLQRLAEAGGGLYSDLQADSSDLRALLQDFGMEAGISSRAEQGTERLVDRWQDRGPWFLLPLLPLAAFAFRRGYPLWMLAGLLIWPLSAPAAPWEALWLRPDQRGQRLFEQGQPGQAAEQFENPLWKAAAYYRAGRYEEVVQLLQGRPEALARYLQGNALAQLGRYAEALAAYDRALETSPEDEDLLHNRALVADLLRRQEQEAREQAADAERGQPGESAAQAGQESAGQAGQESAGQESAGQAGQESAGQAGQESAGQESAGQAGQESAGQAGQESAGQAGQESAAQAGQESAAGQPGETGSQLLQQGEEAPAPQGGPQNSAPEAASLAPRPEDRAGAEEGAQQRDEGALEGGAVSPATRQEVYTSGDLDPEAAARQRESQIAVDAWLRKIPENSGAFLRRKFLRQYRNDPQDGEERDER